ncbi:MAG: lamin tail domain-containing protein [Flavobacteriales bacterium]|nr:lamin tail domain-containing protein [Flavobacteriales bacterium]
MPSKVLSVALLALCSGPSWAQFSDDFADLDINTGVVWSGSTGLFTAATGQLQSQSPGAANYYLSTPSTIVNDAQWEFFIDLRFSTSGANYVDVYLMSDAADLTGGVNGYLLRAGGTADRFELFSSEAGSTFTTGLQSPDNVINSSTSNPFRIKVTRTAAGEWTLFYDDGATGTYLTAGTITDNTTTSATHFGIRIEQSSAASAANNHFFDDISASSIPVDLTPPQIVSVTAVSATSVDVLFNEALDPTTAQDINNYDILPFNSATAAFLDGGDPALVHLTLAQVLVNGNTYTLGVSAVEDLAGNVFVPATPIEFSWVVPDVAEFRDVVINEIMSDPSPVVGLPEVEFVELYNATSDKTFDLEGWTFSDGGTPVAMPSYVLGPGEFVVIMAAASLPLFPDVPNKLGLASLPALNNDGDALDLRDDNNIQIDAVNYALGWYQDGIKDDGGWTLEQIDPTSPCSGATNWRASVASAGGTPGAQNSIFAIVPDTQAPSLLSVQVPNDLSVGLVFNEPMDVSSLIGGTYVITPPVVVTSALPNGSDGVTLNLQDPLVIGTIYTITVTNVTDCPGNAIGTGNTATFALPEAVAAGDVVINEVLYDPIGTGSDFVELYNRSDKVLSLAGWRLATVSDGAVTAGLVITPNSTLLLPGAYALICEDVFNIAATYPQSHIDRFVETDMPSFNNGEGSVVLQNFVGEQLDRFDYTDDLHFTLVNSTEGYSLERVDPDRPTEDNTNWQTAADVAGKATPGFRNSQYTEAPSASGDMTIEPSIFSPDNDGYQDLLTIAYRFDQAGFVGNMSVYDIAGRESRKLMQNQLLGTEGAISWNGILDSGSLGRMGPYIVVLEVYDLAGNVEKFKKTVTLAHKLD